MSKKCRYREGVSFPADPKDVYEVLQKVKRANGGRIEPDKVTEAARPEESPIHCCYPWDNDIAAEYWRDHISKQLIRSVEIVVIRESSPQPAQSAYIGVGSAKTGSCYMSRGEAMSNAEIRQRVVMGVFHQLMGFRRRYGDLTELAPVWAALDEVAIQIDESGAVAAVE
jgi:hypothetical protein